MKNTLLSALFVLCSMPIFATHFVGGDFQICQTGPNTFEVTLRVYRDCLPGNSTTISPTSVFIRDNVTNAQVGSSFSMGTVVSQTVLTLGDSCYTPTGICVEEYVFVKTITLADNPNGYYLEWDDCCRNDLIDNLNDPDNDGMTYYVQIPDPALTGGNCTPDFGSYPSDGYLCIGFDQDIDWGVTDADGDSLVFSLINPFDEALGGPKPFATCAWAMGYGLNNILGNTVQAPMSINSETGIISCHAEFLGVFVFSVMVKEFRDGVQIGEAVRDVQYKSLACVLDTPPQIVLEDSVEVYVSDEICVDMYVFDADGTDTIYLGVESIDFDLAGTYIEPSDSLGNLYYANWQNLGDTLWIDHLDSVNNVYQGLGFIPTRYCWSPGCEDLDSSYHVSLLAYSIGCSGSDTTNKDIVIHVVHDAAPAIDLGTTDTVSVTVADQICFDILITDTIAADTINVVPTSSDFDLLGTYVPPTNLGGGQYYYNNFFGIDTVMMDYYDFNPFTGQVTSIDTIPLRYCFTPGCEAIDEVFVVNLAAFTEGCGGSDTTESALTVIIEFTPPAFTLDIPTELNVTYGESICFELLAEDVSNSGLVLSVEPINEGFDYLASYIAPETLGGTAYYPSFWFNGAQDTLWIDNYSYDETTGAVSGIGDVPIKYCWSPNCGEVLLKEYDLTFRASIYDCALHTEDKDIHVDIDIPVTTVDFPNVFTPHSSPGENDVFKLITTNDVCFDNLSVTIYNRWGLKMFESTDLSFEWDGTTKNGTKCKEGVYYIVLTGSYNGDYQPDGTQAVIPIERGYTVQLMR
jgi:gliding motility-associated-like protein